MLADHSTCSTPRDPEALAQRHHGARRRSGSQVSLGQLFGHRLFELGLDQELLQADVLALQLFQRLPSLAFMPSYFAPERGQVDSVSS